MQYGYQWLHPVQDNFVDISESKRLICQLINAVATNHAKSAEPLTWVPRGAGADVVVEHVLAGPVVLARVAAALVDLRLTELPWGNEGRLCVIAWDVDQDYTRT